jgi:hypothetical protein
MLDTDRETMSNLILEGLDEGLSVPQIRNNISDKFDDISKKQSTRITRTEVMRASTWATSMPSSNPALSKPSNG